MTNTIFGVVGTGDRTTGSLRTRVIDTHGTRGTISRSCCWACEVLTSPMVGFRGRSFVRVRYWTGGGLWGSGWTEDGVVGGQGGGKGAKGRERGDGKRVESLGVIKSVQMRLGIFQERVEVNLAINEEELLINPLINIAVWDV